MLAVVLTGGSLRLFQTCINFDGTLSSWWTKIVTGVLLFAFIAFQQATLALARRSVRGTAARGTTP
ncbi:hypothetical protein CYD53_11560 [Bosea psychrotolerans]|uniref:Uncharacterized protein n=1 Tax=Bosea psychrotolerans TaxID=1871628 RepID=A0A2S4M0R3_9HYPH|nr:hypothetical protein CYD53_11560 [Bosea psychrotolerans]